MGHSAMLVGAYPAARVSRGGRRAKIVTPRMAAPLQLCWAALPPPCAESAQSVIESTMEVLLGSILGDDAQVERARQITTLPLRMGSGFMGRCTRVSLLSGDGGPCPVMCRRPRANEVAFGSVCKSGPNRLLAHATFGPIDFWPRLVKPCCKPFRTASANRTGLGQCLFWPLAQREAQLSPLLQSRFTPSP